MMPPDPRRPLAPILIDGNILIQSSINNKELEKELKKELEAAREAQSYKYLKAQEVALWMNRFFIIFATLLALAWAPLVLFIPNLILLPPLFLLGILATITFLTQLRNEENCERAIIRQWPKIEVEAPLSLRQKILREAPFVSNLLFALAISAFITQINFFSSKPIVGSVFLSAMVTILLLISFASKKWISRQEETRLLAPIINKDYTTKGPLICDKEDSFIYYKNKRKFGPCEKIEKSADWKEGYFRIYCDRNNIEKPSNTDNLNQSSVQGASMNVEIKIFWPNQNIKLFSLYSRRSLIINIVIDGQGEIVEIKPQWRSPLLTKSEIKEQKYNKLLISNEAKEKFMNQQESGDPSFCIITDEQAELGENSGAIYFAK